MRTDAAAQAEHRLDEQRWLDQSAIEEVRGFNPVDAGNVRMEGLTFDQQAQPSNRLVDSSAIRVGYAARGYPFPAPTGIVDLKLEKYEQTDVASIEIESDDQGNVGGSILAKFGIGGD